MYNPARRLISLEEGQARCFQWRRILEQERVPLVNAAGRVLAEDVIAEMPLPPFSNSAMDGFAFRFSDLPATRRLRLSGRAVAGESATANLPSGSAMRIFTGAPIPRGADTIALQEHCEVNGSDVILPAAISPGANCRREGEDVETGELVLEHGRRLRTQDIAMAAALGRADLLVRRRIRVALLATGSELYAPGALLRRGAIYDANGPALGSALTSLGADVTNLGVVPDRFEALTDILRTAAPAHDLVLSTGGVSVGEEDHVKAAVLRTGQLEFWRLALKPGKPVAIGSIGSVPFIGLPGNPVAALITFWFLARPALLHLGGVIDPAVLEYAVVSAFDRRHAEGRREFLRVNVKPRNDGLLAADLVDKQGSAALSSLVGSNGLVSLHETRGDVSNGDFLPFIPYGSLL